MFYNVFALLALFATLCSCSPSFPLSKVLFEWSRAQPFPCSAVVILRDLVMDKDQGNYLSSNFVLKI